MGSKERIIRQKEETRCKILAAAMEISRAEGWQALSMRKIADKIEYTAPIIYEYFENKDALMTALTRIGHEKLSKLMQEKAADLATPEEKIMAMWRAYWDFAFKDKEFYQLMYGVEVSCCQFEKNGADFELPAELIWDVIEEFPGAKGKTEEEICKIYYTYWSVVHGLISINLVQEGTILDQINSDVFNNAINAISNSIK
ncbi:MAG: TetR family transcriptional regulator [Pseudopedobacter saltans]|uniref:TetR family transcriptional regulator n=1 Tax=Pseudopedobacter saltans TaxID=151895 RepID=A0A2W5F7L8_9SPHI|nr:MAG: TetR family transcriptional regulator [Pseudopedobacter saltans]